MSALIGGACTHGFASPKVQLTAHRAPAAAHRECVRFAVAAPFRPVCSHTVLLVWKAFRHLAGFEMRSRFASGRSD